MQEVSCGLGNGRYDALREWLHSPRARVQRVLQVSALSWWPEGVPPVRHARRAAGVNTAANTDAYLPPRVARRA